MRKGISFSVGGLAALAVFIVALAIESIIPGAIIHFAAGVKLITAMLWCMLGQAVLLILFVVATTAFGIGALKD